MKNAREKTFYHLIMLLLLSITITISINYYYYIIIIIILLKKNNKHLLKIEIIYNKLIYLKII